MPCPGNNAIVGAAPMEAPTICAVTNLGLLDGAMPGACRPASAEGRVSV